MTSHCAELRNRFKNYYKRNAGLFVQSVYEGLGIKKGSRGQPVLETANTKRRRPQDVDVKELTIEWFRDSGPGTPEENAQRAIENAKSPQVAQFLRDARQANIVLEASSTAVVPGDLADVSAYLGTVTGLLDAAVLEGYESPAFIADKLCPTEKSNLRQKKMIGVSGSGDVAAIRKPGQPWPMSQLKQRYVTTPETEQKAAGVELTYEAVFFDQTDQVMAQAREIGESIRLLREKDFFRLLAGQSLYNTYTYGGTTYNTYGTSGNWVNDEDGPLEDWTDLAEVRALFGRMTSQETGERISIMFDTIIVSDARLPNVDRINSATTLSTRTNYSSGNLQESVGPYNLPRYNVVTSPIFDQILTDTAANKGMALTQAQANDWWFAMNTDPAKAPFRRMENWPLRTDEAKDGSYSMLKYGIVAALYAQVMDTWAIVEPRAVVRRTHTGYSRS